METHSRKEGSSAYSAADFRKILRLNDNVYVIENASLYLLMFIFAAIFIAKLRRATNLFILSKELNITLL